MEWSSLFLLFFVGWLGASGWGLYEQMKPSPCNAESPFSSAAPPGMSSSSGCLRPLFPPSERVDVRIYATLDTRLGRWRSKAAFSALVPLWSKLNVSLSERVEASATLPPALATHARSNGSLALHVIVVRAGHASNPSMHPIVADPRRFRSAREARDGKKETPWARWRHMLHASATLTRHLEASAGSYGKLLDSSDSSQDGSSSSGGGGSGSSSIGTFLVFGVAVQPEAVLQWGGLAFALSAWCAPSPLVAAVRGALAYGVFPYTVREKLRLDAEATAAAAAAEASSRRFAPIAKPNVIHIRPNVRIRIVSEAGHFSLSAPPPMLFTTLGNALPLAMPSQQQEQSAKSSAPPPVAAGAPRRMGVVAMDDRGGDTRYAPPLFVDDAAIMRRDWRELSTNVSRAPPSIAITLEPIGRIHYSVLQQMLEASSMYEAMGMGEREIDEVKWMLFSRPIHVLIAMQLISFIQIALSTLAFKNEIAFFKGRTDFAGLSSRSLATDAIQAWVIFFYLLDYEHASRVVLFQLGAGALIASWKVRRRMRISLVWSYALPWLRTPGAEEGGAARLAEHATEEIDQLAMRYMKYFLYPLSLCWGVYCLAHYEYKSWWSWLISSLADFAYTFGFVNMLPQVFINYKLKSVAHMPWRVLVYKAFNTFIDDVFAFWIMADRTTKKHRLMTLRDDIVFVIFLVQWYMYPKDRNRADEFGYTYDGAAKGEGAAAGAAGEEEEEEEQPPPLLDAIAAASGKEDREEPNFGAMSNVGPNVLLASPGFGAAAAQGVASRLAAGFAADGSVGGPFSKTSPPPRMKFGGYLKGCTGVVWKSTALNEGVVAEADALGSGDTAREEGTPTVAVTSASAN